MEQHIIADQKLWDFLIHIWDSIRKDVGDLEEHYKNLSWSQKRRGWIDSVH